MARQVINIGAFENDNSADIARVSFTKVNAMTAELYGPIQPDTLTTHASSATVTTRYNLADAGGGGITLTLPSASTVTGIVLWFKKIAGAGTVTIDAAGSETIEGSLTVLLASLGDVVGIISDGTAWYIITP